MNIRWLGHSSFLLTADNGLRLVTDPYDESVGYPLQKTEADVVCISHEHHDHNNRFGIEGNPIIVDQTGEHDVCGVRITGYSTWHDDVQGNARGKNIMFSFQIDGLHVLHMGDLGCMLEESQIKQIGAVDVLMVPVGGVYTIGPREAWTLCERIHPRVILPMHYKLPCVQYGLEPVENFLECAGVKDIKRVESLFINPLNLSRLDSIVLMQYGDEVRANRYASA